MNNKGAKEHDDAWPSREAAVNYTEAFPEEIEQALFEHAAKDFKVLKRMLPEAARFEAPKEIAKCSSFFSMSTFPPA